jgi:DNA-binding MarR family transcriptional regulator
MAGPQTSAVGRDPAARAAPGSAPASGSTWTFLTNHAHVLLAIAADPDLRLRDVSERIGITERAAQRIVGELEAEGYLEVRRVGRRNAYRVHAELPLRHPAERHHRVGELLEVLSHEQGGRRANECRAARDRSGCGVAGPVNDGAGGRPGSTTRPASCRPDASPGGARCAPRPGGG